MSFQKVLVIKGDIPGDTKTIGDDTKFVGITEMFVDIDLLNGWIGTGLALEWEGIEP